MAKEKVDKIESRTGTVAKLMNGGKKAQNEHIGHSDKLKLSGI